ncbi:hypothetical protein ACIBH1_20190 [Nonomuraea sp. NPDC050663]|uniref:hypothetical protein n=1 Tax=Nonomuraea sp. NPDC050663 TaxID=3364370 RepID=UPI0037B11F28
MRRILPALTLAAVLSLMAGCGASQAAGGVASVSGATATAAAPTATATADPLEQGREFAQCMRDNGVPMEDPDPNQGLAGRLGKVDRNSAAFVKALEACRDVAPFADRKELAPEDLEKMRAFAACMRDNGVDMPDPDLAGGFAAQIGKISPDDPKVAKALEACNDELGSMRGRK